MAKNAAAVLFAKWWLDQIVRARGKEITMQKEPLSLSDHQLKMVRAAMTKLSENDRADFVKLTINLLACSNEYTDKQVLKALRRASQLRKNPRDTMAVMPTAGSPPP
jgi:hypothetical protein